MLLGISRGVPCYRRFGRSVAEWGDSEQVVIEPLPGRRAHRDAQVISPLFLGVT